MNCCATVGPRSWLDSDLPLFPERTHAHLLTQENGPLTVHWLISRVSVQCVSVGPRLRSSLTSISWAFPSLSRRCCLWMRLTFFSHCSEHDLGFCCTHCTPPSTQENEQNTTNWKGSIVLRTCQAAVFFFFFYQQGAVFTPKSEHFINADISKWHHWTSWFQTDLLFILMIHDRSWNLLIQNIASFQSGPKDSLK